MAWGLGEVEVRFGDRVALRDVSLAAENGRVTGVIGGDGAGKSTLLRCLVGSIAPTRGSVDRPAATGIGYLSSTSGTYPDLTVKQNLAFAARAYGVSAVEVERRTKEYLEKTGLDRTGDRLAGALSGGMRQKLGVIRAMLHRPALLVLDEPTTGVDPVSRADLWWLIALAASEGAAVVVATTYLDEAERMSWLLALDAGSPVAEGPPDEIAAGLPGCIYLSDTRPQGEAARWSWRRGMHWRVWMPPGRAREAKGCGDATVGGQGDRRAVAPDLSDAIIVAALRREREDPSQVGRT